MPIKIIENAGKPYRPSNGTEGEIFMSAWCNHCYFEDIHDPHSEMNCGIITLTHALDIGDEDYPKEWVFDESGKPKCTAFSLRGAKETVEPRCEKTADMFT